MKFKCKPFIKTINGINWLVSEIPSRLVPELEKVLKHDDITVDVSKTKVKRSQTANSYFWVILGKLSEVLTIPKGDLYVKMLKQYGIYESLIIKQEAFSQLEYIWNIQNSSVEHSESLIDVTHTFDSKGVTWVEFNAHYGTSSYNSKQFNTLLEGLISDCKLANVETLPPAEVERLIKLMEG